MPEIESAYELSNFAAKLLLSLWIQWKRTEVQIRALVPSRITQADADFILSVPQNSE